MAKSISIFWIFRLFCEKDQLQRADFQLFPNVPALLEAFSEGEFPVPKEQAAKGSGGMTLLAR